MSARTVAAGELVVAFPEPFVAVPVGHDDGWDALTRAVLPGLPEPLRPAVADWYAGLGAAAEQAGVAAAAMCLGTDEGGRATSAFVTVGLAPSPHEDPVVAAEALLRREARATDGTTVLPEPVDLGGGQPGYRIGDRLLVPVVLERGPCLAVLRRDTWRLPAPPGDESAEETAGGATGTPAGQDVTVGTVQAFLPLPGAPAVAVLTLTTPDVDRLEQYAGVLGAVATTVEVR